MTPLEIIAEWEKGCSCASLGKPEECAECTGAALRAIKDRLTKDSPSLAEIVTHMAASMGLEADVSALNEPFALTEAEHDAIFEQCVKDAEAYKTKAIDPILNKLDDDGETH